MVHYSYPDPGELVTIRMIEETTGSGGYWEASEALALEAARTVIVNALGDNRDRTALDVGTGEGRLLPWLASVASEIRAQDPDVVRLDVARERWDALARDDATVTFANDLASLGLPGPAAVVMCSHVFQHVPEAVRAELMDAITAHAADDAVLVVSFSQGDEREDFRLEQVRDGELVVQPIDREGFEAHAAGASADADNSLPIHYLIAEEVALQLAQRGWREQLRWGYHVTNTEHAPSLGADIVANAAGTGSAASGARDVVIVLRRSIDG